MTKADEAIRLANELRAILRDEVDLPLPADETDGLLYALAKFCAASAPRER